MKLTPSLILLAATAATTAAPLSKRNSDGAAGSSVVCFHDFLLDICFYTDRLPTTTTTSTSDEGDDDVHVAPLDEMGSNQDISYHGDDAPPGGGSGVVRRDKEGYCDFSEGCGDPKTIIRSDSEGDDDVYVAPRNENNVIWDIYHGDAADLDGDLSEVCDCVESDPPDPQSCSLWCHPIDAKTTAGNNNGRDDGTMPPSILDSI
ncbi:hypothetical protein B0T17DRAFT_511239 [Bombardia bombarda]|uniref:Uncharacterized protein n=1 Tax=Bombardia bombarda TaxID=252184 RepID=A0AA39WAX9_9PEZI|nr:hypothetical protein B0T17DRAFT_511239 [Bombardia bombarda]